MTENRIFGHVGWPLWKSRKLAQKLAQRQKWNNGKLVIPPVFPRIDLQIPIPVNK
jgi:hypothetical protein